MSRTGGNAMTRWSGLLGEAVSALQGQLPPGWHAAEAGPASFAITAPDGRTATLDALIRARMDPRRAREVVGSRRARAEAPPVLVCPWVSPRTRAVLVEAGLSYVATTGGARLVMASPGLCVDWPGLAHDPQPDPRAPTLAGPTAGRVARALLALAAPEGVRALATRSATTPGYVSRLLTWLDAELVLERTDDGKVAAVDRTALLTRWATDAPVAERAEVTTWTDPRGVGNFLAGLRSSSHRYAVTGPLAAARRAPVSGPRAAAVYVEDAAAFADAMGLRPVAGGYVSLWQPRDPLAFAGRWCEDGIWYAALPLVALDLVTTLGLEPTQPLLDWLGAQPDAWAIPEA